MPVMDRQGFYPSDLSTAQWDAIKELVPSARRGGRPRTTKVRQVIDAILYLVNTGCAWRYLPKSFPPWKTVYHYFRQWTLSGTWKLIHDHLVKFTRCQAQKNETPSYLIIDSQSTKASGGELLGYDGFKRVRGRKRQILVDTLGLVHGIYIHAADLTDPKEGAKLIEKISPQTAERLEVMNADMGYRGTFEDKFFERFNFMPLILRRENTGQGKKKTAKEKRQWKRTREKVVTPKRWIVERTFAWFNNYRRLARDYEKKVGSSEAMIYLGMTQLMLRRHQCAILQ